MNVSTVSEKTDTSSERVEALDMTNLAGFVTHIEFERRVMADRRANMMPKWASVRPARKLVLVRREAPPKQIGSILIPDQARKGLPTAMVVAIGSECNLDGILAGDRVALTALGTKLDADYWLVPEENVAMWVADDLVVA